METEMETATGMATETAMRLIFLLTATVSLAACVTAPSEKRTGRTCPSVVEYSAEFQTQVADELARLPEDSAIVELLSDYASMREQVRGMCRGVAKPLDATDRQVALIFGSGPRSS